MGADDGRYDGIPDGIDVTEWGVGAWQWSMVGCLECGSYSEVGMTIGRRGVNQRKLRMTGRVTVNGGVNQDDGCEAQVYKACFRIWWAVMVGFRVDMDGSVDAAVALEARLNGQLLADQGSFFSAKWAPDWSLLFAGFDGDKNTVGHND